MPVSRNRSARVELPPSAKTTAPKDKEKERRSMRRYRARDDFDYAFDTFSLSNDGIISPGPSIDYPRVLEGKKGPLFGVELETEHRTEYEDPDDWDEDGSISSVDLEKRLARLKGKYFVCTDGSLRRGAEIVIAPMSVTGWRAEYTNIYKTLKTLSKGGYISHQSGRCGLHIHVSRGNGRNGYTSEQAARARQFLDDYQELFAAISRRDDFQYCQFERSSHVRYSALNLTNSQTVEYRFFRGTLIPASFFGAIETVFALTDYFVADRRSYSFAGFLKILKQYPFALRQVEQRCPSALKRGYLAERIAERKRATQEREEYERRARIRDNIIDQSTCFLESLSSVIAQHLNDRMSECFRSECLIPMNYPNSAHMNLGALTVGSSVDYARIGLRGMNILYPGCRSWPVAGTIRIGSEGRVYIIPGVPNIDEESIASLLKPGKTLADWQCERLLCTIPGHVELYNARCSVIRNGGASPSLHYAIVSCERPTPTPTPTLTATDASIFADSVFGSFPSYTLTIR